MATVTTVQNYLAVVHAPGAYQNVRWTSVVKPAAAHKGVLLEKSCTAKVRTGIDYSHLGVNADTVTGPLKWGAWFLFPYVIVHNGEFYARLYVEDGTVRATYKVNGVEVHRDTFGGYLTESARQSRRPKGGTIVVKLDNVTLL